MGLDKRRAVHGTGRGQGAHIDKQPLKFRFTLNNSVFNELDIDVQYLE